jgi:K+-transporting ATPase KdpF subunit
MPRSSDELAGAGSNAYELFSLSLSQSYARGVRVKKDNKHNPGGQVNAGPDFHSGGSRVLRRCILVRALLRTRVAGEHGLARPKEPDRDCSDDTSLRCARLFEGAKGGQRDKEMNAEYIASGIVALLLLFYLMYALLKPEKF